MGYGFVDYLIKNMVMLITMIVIVLLVLQKGHSKKRFSIFILITIFLLLVLSITTYVEIYLKSIGNHDIARRNLIMISYILRPLIYLTCIYSIIDLGKKRNILIQIPTLINLIIYLTAIFTDKIAFGIENNEFIKGSLIYSCIVVSMINIILITIYTMVKFKNSKLVEKLILCTALIFSMIAEIIEFSGYDMYLLNQILMVSILIYFIFVSLQMNKEYEAMLLEKQKIELMVSQIQPHFMYNMLTTIYGLCDYDKEKAKYAIVEFSSYLRHNLDSIGNEDIVEFSDELNYVKNYLTLEKIRFDDELNIEYDINFTNFRIPKFTLQPIVENAIKYGVSQNENGGTIKISVNEENDYAVIKIENDGPGFDSTENKDGTRSHTGIKNINYRLNAYCNESLNIISEKGKKGAVVSFKILKDVKRK